MRLKRSTIIWTLAFVGSQLLRTVFPGCVEAMSSGHGVERVSTSPATAGVTTGLLKSIGDGSITCAMQNGMQGMVDSLVEVDLADLYQQTVHFDGGKNRSRTVIYGRDPEEYVGSEPGNEVDVKIVTLSVPSEVQAQDQIVQSELINKVEGGEFGSGARIVVDTIVISNQDYPSLGLQNVADSNSSHVKARVNSNGTWEYYIVYTLNNLTYIAPFGSGNSFVSQAVKYLAHFNESCNYDDNSNDNNDDNNDSCIINAGSLTQVLESLTAVRSIDNNNEIIISRNTPELSGTNIIPLEINGGTYYFDTEKQQVSIRTEAGVEFTMSYDLFEKLFLRFNENSIISPNKLIVRVFDSLDQETQEKLFMQLNMSSKPQVVQANMNYESILRHYLANSNNVGELWGYGVLSNNSVIVLPPSSQFFLQKGVYWEYNAETTLSTIGYLFLYNEAAKETLSLYFPGIDFSDPTQGNDVWAEGIPSQGSRVFYGLRYEDEVFDVFSFRLSDIKDGIIYIRP